MLQLLWPPLGNCVEADDPSRFHSHHIIIIIKMADLKTTTSIFVLQVCDFNLLYDLVVGKFEITKGPKLGFSTKISYKPPVIVSTDSFSHFAWVRFEKNRYVKDTTLADVTRKKK